MLGMSDVGVYSVAYQIGMVISLIQNSFNQAWVPFFFQKLNEDTSDSKRKIVQITYWYIGFLMLMTAVIYFMIPVTYKYFINESYIEGAKLIVWVLLGFLFNGIYKMMVNFLFYDKKTKLIAKLSLSSAMLNIGLNYILIKFNGITGAAQATMITFLFFMVIVLVTTLKKYKMPWIDIFKKSKNI